MTSEAERRSVCTPRSDRPDRPTAQALWTCVKVVLPTQGVGTRHLLLKPPPDGRRDLIEPTRRLMRSTRLGAVYRRSRRPTLTPRRGQRRETPTPPTPSVGDAPALKKSRAAPGDGGGPLQAYPVLGEDRLRSLQVLPNGGLLPYSFGLRSTVPSARCTDRNRRATRVGRVYSDGDCSITTRCWTTPERLDEPLVDRRGGSKRSTPVRE